MKSLIAIALSLAAAASTLAEEAAAKFKVSVFDFTRPAAWKQIEPKSTMRKAQLEVPGKDGGKPAEVVFFYFGSGQGGDTTSNVTRWFAQFTGGTDVQKTETLDLNGTKTTLVSTEGTLKASPFAGIPEELPNAALLGAILDHAEGAVFIKMTGPADVVKESRETFLEMLKSATVRK